MIITFPILEQPPAIPVHIPNPTDHVYNFLIDTFDAPLNLEDQFKEYVDTLVEDYQRDKRIIHPNKNESHILTLKKIARFTRNYLQTPNHIFSAILADKQPNSHFKYLNNNATLDELMQAHHRKLYIAKELFATPSDIWYFGRNQLYRDVIIQTATVGKMVM